MTRFLFAPNGLIYYRPLQKLATSMAITMNAYHVKFDRLLGNKYEVEITSLFVIITPVGKPEFFSGFFFCNFFNCSLPARINSLLITRRSII